jgi:cell shape-determining protein MreC
MSPDSQQSQLAAIKQRVEDLLHRFDRVEDTQRSFVNETGARIKVEAEIQGDLRSACRRIDDLEDWRDEIEARLRDAKKFKTTTAIAVGGLVMTALVIVIGVIGLVH